MLSRYTIYRRRPVGAPPLPDGIRKDTRWRTRHVLRPTKQIVEVYLEDPTDEAWQVFHDAYFTLLAERLATSTELFDELASLCNEADVYLGCSCPTKQQPRVDRCHTWLALEFMKQNFPGIAVEFPKL
ncbi:DUF488 family protein, N3 subclade [Roseiconus lacunae]|uniref:DUF488 domain-containing protein n=1 Tax=Roseiconus lacunae TaxID=2605694 RepID=A0ABT7PNZ8_9BACT|nr:hypothetical protein [Roseiconus lacunae]MDM4018201.1 hypothetical protein [Roseiconus lacunae]